jgi:hypothetical protein
MFAKIRVTHISLRSVGGKDKTLVSAGDPALVRVMVVFTVYGDIFFISTDNRPREKLRA